LATENRTQDAGHARFNISTKNKTESAQEFGRYLFQCRKAWSTGQRHMLFPRAESLLGYPRASGPNQAVKPSTSKPAKRKPAERRPPA